MPRRVLSSHSRDRFLTHFSATLAVLLLAGGLTSISGQTFTVLHHFTGGQDGAYPSAGLTIDTGGKLYGTALAGGTGSCSPQQGCGTVFQMKRAGTGWVFTPIYMFAGGDDGSAPYARVTIGPNGSLYGTTSGGGSQNCQGGCGTVYNLQPPLSICKTTLCFWSERVLYRFSGTPDGFYPIGDIIFDHSGAIYGTTTQGGSTGPGIVYKLAHSNGSWSETVLYSLTGQSDGGNPYSGVILDTAGNLYGTAVAGGSGNNGAIFQLKPSGSGWVENTLYDFPGGTDGGTPYPGLVIDNNGKLYGATSQSGQNMAGVIYQLTPSGGGWSYSVLEQLSGGPSSGPWATLTMDSAGNLYGTTQGDPDQGNFGTVFKLTRSGGGWIYSVLHQFTGADGSTPYSNVTVDAAGNLYGTTLLGGNSGKGIVWEITP